MRERNLGQASLRVAHQSKNNENIKIENDDKPNKNNGRRKVTRKIIRAGSLVRK